MSGLFKNKYRIDPARLQAWDYASNGMYFITICTQNREHLFGDITDGIMYLNDIGKIAEQCWADIPNHFAHIESGVFVIMPNHTHGIICINNPYVVETRHALSRNRPDEHDLSRNRPIQSNNEQPTPHFRFRNQGKNTISSIVGSFKSATTKLARTHHADFGWQTRFHDHIIHTQDEFIRISNYIIDNPLNWGKDEFHPD